MPVIEREDQTIEVLLIFRDIIEILHNKIIETAITGATPILPMLTTSIKKKRKPSKKELQGLFLLIAAGIATCLILQNSFFTALYVALLMWITVFLFFRKPSEKILAQWKRTILTPSIVSAFIFFTAIILIP